MSIQTVAKSAYESDERRWEAVLTRDAAADRHFVYAVKTTGIYAYPSAATRRPKRDHVRFFASAAAAEAAGYRANRREQERVALAQQRVALVTTACRFIAAADTPPDLAMLSRQARMSPAHFHRLFKAETGLTPKAYGAALRAQRLREQLGQPQQRVTDAIYGAGFQANSRFYETSHARLGMRAKDYRRGGRGALIRFALGQSTLGAILVAQSQLGICAIFIGDEAEALLCDLQDQFPHAELVGGDAAFEQLVAHVVGFIEQPALGLDLPLDIQGTAFQERVWQALRAIPPGTTLSYTDLAQRIGLPRAVRAVAQACAANRLAVAIPCHRVVRHDGDLSGYRWGVQRKQQLLDRECEISRAAQPAGLRGPP